MREQIHTIPVNEAFDAHDECPFCFMERKVEQSAIRFVAGSGASSRGSSSTACTSSS